MKRIVILGGGGHARVLIDLIRVVNEYEIAGILDSRLNKEDTIAGIPIVGGDDMLHGLFSDGITLACIGVGSVGDNSIRKRLYEKVKQVGFAVPCLVHPKAVTSDGSRICEGVQVMAGTVIQSNAFIGENSIINSGAIVDHDCVVGKHVHISPGAVLSGGVILGERVFIGAGATVIQGVKIGSNALVSAGAVVIRDVPDGAKVMGVPAK